MSKDLKELALAVVDRVDPEQRGIFEAFYLPDLVGLDDEQDEEEDEFAARMGPVDPTLPGYVFDAMRFLNEQGVVFVVTGIDIPGLIAGLRRRWRNKGTPTAAQAEMQEQVAAALIAVLETRSGESAGKTSPSGGAGGPGDDAPAPSPSPDGGS